MWFAYIHLCAARCMFVFVCVHTCSCTHALHLHMQVCGALWEKYRGKWEVIKRNLLEGLERREITQVSAQVTLGQCRSWRAGNASQAPSWFTLFELSLYFHLIASLIFLGNNYKTNFSNKMKLLLCSTLTVTEQVRARSPRAVLSLGLAEHWLDLGKQSLSQHLSWLRG